MFERRVRPNSQPNMATRVNPLFDNYAVATPSGILINGNFKEKPTQNTGSGYRTKIVLASAGTPVQFGEEVKFSGLRSEVFTYLMLLDNTVTPGWGGWTVLGATVAAYDAHGFGLGHGGAYSCGLITYTHNEGSGQAVIVSYSFPDKRKNRLVGIVVSGLGVKLFVDGLLVASATASNTVRSYSPAVFTEIPGWGASFPIGYVLRASSDLSHMMPALAVNPWSVFWSTPDRRWPTVVSPYPAPRPTVPVKKPVFQTKRVVRTSQPLYPTLKLQYYNSLTAGLALCGVKLQSPVWETPCERTVHTADYANLAGRTTVVRGQGWYEKYGGSGYKSRISSLNSPAVVNSETKTFTVAGIFYKNGASAAEVIAASNPSAPDLGTALLNTDNTLTCTWNGDVSVVTTLLAREGVNIVVLTNDKTNAKQTVYLNGVKDPAEGASVAQGTFSLGYLKCGALSTGDVALSGMFGWTRVLSEEEILKFSANPWSLFIPKPRVSPASFPAPATASTPTLFYGIYQAVNADPRPEQIVNAQGNPISSNQAPAPVGTAMPFTGHNPATQLTTNTDYKLAQVYFDGTNYSNVAVTTFTTLGINIYRPGSDISTAGWTGSPDNVTLYTNISEETPSDTGYIVALNTADPISMGLDNPVPIGSYDISVRANYVDTGGKLRVVMLDDANTILAVSSWQTLTGTYTTYLLHVTLAAQATRFRIEVAA